MGGCLLFQSIAPGGGGPSGWWVVGGGGLKGAPGQSCFNESRDVTNLHIIIIVYD